jgi:hypothetical protein
MNVSKAGDRLRCENCGTEIIVVKPPSGPVSCCGVEMAARDATPAAPTESKEDDGQHAR